MKRMYRIVSWQSSCKKEGKCRCLWRRWWAFYDGWNPSSSGEIELEIQVNSASLANRLYRNKQLYDAPVGALKIMSKKSEFLGLLGSGVSVTQKPLFWPTKGFLHFRLLFWLFDGCLDFLNWTAWVLRNLKLNYILWCSQRIENEIFP